MQDMTQLGALVVYKSTALNENQGFVVPVFLITDDNKYIPIDRYLYPSDILISRGFSDVDSAYHDEELFLLQTHFKDEQKTIEAGAARYWAKGDSVCNLATSTMLPVFTNPLPPKETGTLPIGVIPPRGTFFLKEGNSIYGPLTSSENDDGAYVIEPLTHPSLSLGKDYLGHYLSRNIETCLISTFINRKEYQFITSIKDLSSYPVDKVDYMADDRLIKFFNQQGFGKNLKGLAKKEAERLQQVISQSEKTHQSVKTERLDRLKTLLERYLNESDIGFELIKSHLTSPPGVKFLTEYVESNKDNLLNAHLEKVQSDAKAQEEQIQKQLSEFGKQIDLRRTELEKIQLQVTDERERAKDKIARIQAETEEQARHSLEIKQEELSLEVKAKEDELTIIQSQIDEKTKRLNLVDQIDKLKSDCNYYESHSDKLKAAVKGFEDALNDPEKLASKMVEMEVVSRVLNGGTAAVTPTVNNYKLVSFASNEPASGEQVVELLCNHFEDDGGRPFSKEEMTNLIVSINQSFMTVLSGPPGVGKTSTITRLASAMHLGDVSGRQNFLYVPVGRGWVSSRDVLGFYNSLKGVYQESRTGLYDFLKKDDNNADKLQATKLILLDEANLSSIEHYWSDFLGMCDQEGRNRPIDTGILASDNRYLNISNNVRFVATINNDATTERLSPRLIDRVPIISLTQAKSDIIPSETSSDLKLDGAVDANRFNKFFSLPDTELSRSNEAILSQIIELFHKRDSEYGQIIPISHRKIISITNYCAVAGNIIGPEIAMDFAISQHILPHIEGYGAKFRKRVQELLPILNKSYPRSTYHVERILTGGNEFTGTYSFF
ncbi:AAA family ATPase [Aeromonas hydrophila]|uniref:AAA family ATPase n=1 Tax=Aeromonas hydrophila TaxID=644 RepID=UPI002B488DF4|nr:AAA family ATPase [Aeromonas hydrophila]